MTKGEDIVSAECSGHPWQCEQGVDGDDGTFSTLSFFRVSQPEGSRDTSICVKSEAIEAPQVTPTLRSASRHSAFLFFTVRLSQSPVLRCLIHSLLSPSSFFTAHKKYKKTTTLTYVSLIAMKNSAYFPPSLSPVSFIHQSTLSHFIQFHFLLIPLLSIFFPLLSIL
ncbi:hypothetical protein E2C01_051585 [Portunus trituberculatus]|uniref:Uncharacterized protein n=1 Tax=Portunus trituberculatus TaxID=210409 RepID=A0A5B7GC03_PORTR|nr:hypothetical protein [Portunus trituberculatus]